MNISLTPELEKMVQSCVASGQYNNASEVVRDALRLMIRRDAMGHYYDEWLRVQIESGWQQAERGELVPFNMQEIIDEVLAEHAAGK